MPREMMPETDVFGQRREAHDGKRDDAERPLGAHECSQQIVARDVCGLAAQPLDVALRRHDLHPEHVTRRHAVGETVQAAGVLCDVAADGAGGHARRIRNVAQAAVSHRGADVGVDDARFDDGDPVRDVDVHDASQPRRGDHDRPVGDRATRQSSPRAARHERHLVPAAQSYDGSDLLRGGRKDDGSGSGVVDAGVIRI